MEYPLIIPTERDQTFLRLMSPSDAAAYLAFVNKNRDHLSVFEPEYAEYQPSIPELENAIPDPSSLSDQSRVNYLILVDENLAGITQLTPTGGGCAEIGYGLGMEYLHQGNATVAVRSLARFALAEYSVYATPLIENVRSVRVLERCNFTENDSFDYPGHRFFILR